MLMDCSALREVVYRLEKLMKELSSRASLNELVETQER